MKRVILLIFYAMISAHHCMLITNQTSTLKG